MAINQRTEQRANQRNFTQDNINDAIKNPLEATETKYDNQGRPSVKYIGINATVVLNPKTGLIITVYPTSTQRINNLLRRGK